MGLLQKLKNTFFEEEYVEVEEEEEKVSKKVEKKQVQEPKVEIKPVEEERKVEEIKEEKKVTLSYEDDFDDEDDDFDEEPVFSDRDIVKKNTKLSYFDDEDFVDKPYQEPVKATPVKQEEPKKIYGQTRDDAIYDIKIETGYNNTMPYGNTNKTKFQPTPIISPIYGILDKNYNKDEIIDKKDKPSSFVSRKNADLDSIRRKAYGNISIFDEETKEEEQTEEKEPLLYDMMVDDNKPVVDQVTMADAEEYFNDLGLEYNVDYKDANYEKATGRRTKKIEEEANDLDEVIINKNTNYDDGDELEDNLFDLVDSIYEDGEE